MRKHSVFGLIVIIAAVILVLITYRNDNIDTPSQTTRPTAPNTSKEQSVPFNKQQFSLDDPASVWVIVNKQRPLNPKTYAPDDLRTPSMPLRGSASNPEMKLRNEAATALEAMHQAAQKDGISLMLASGYRSYSTQVAVYNNFVKTQGQQTADTQSARPGHSEHQTGLAADIAPANKTCVIEDCFAATKEGKWVAANSYKYGFLVRYQQNTADIVGYKYEPWHLRYVGTALATEIQKNNMTPLETFFNLANAGSY